MKFTKYEKLGAYHWREYECGTTYGQHALLVENWVQGEKILDVGAGDGLITKLIGAVGIDNEQSGIDIAKQKGVDVRFGDAYDLPFDDGVFDAVFMGDTIEHLETPEKALNEAARVLEDGGFLYVATPPKRDKPHSCFHYKEYTPEELVAFVEDNDFTSVQEPFVKNERIYAKFTRNSRI